MPKLTSIQANELANNFLELAKQVGDYRYNHSNISAEENEQFKNYHEVILNYADELFTLSASLILDDLGPSLNTISDITNEIKVDYKNLENIQKAINVATSIVDLGAAIVSKNPRMVVETLEGLVGSWEG